MGSAGSVIVDESTSLLLSSLVSLSVTVVAPVNTCCLPFLLCIYQSTCIMPADTYPLVSLPPRDLLLVSLLLTDVADASDGISSDKLSALLCKTQNNVCVWLCVLGITWSANHGWRLTYRTGRFSNNGFCSSSFNVGCFSPGRACVWSVSIYPSQLCTWPLHTRPASKKPSLMTSVCLSSPDCQYLADRLESRILSIACWASIVSFGCLVMSDSTSSALE